MSPNRAVSAVALLLVFIIASNGHISHEELNCETNTTLDAQGTVFLELGASNVRGSASAAARRNVDEAREKLNSMVGKTQTRWDSEDVQCMASIRRKKEIAEQSKEDMAVYLSQSAQDRADYIRVTNSIGALAATATKLNEQLKETKADYKTRTDSLESEITTMEADAIVLEAIFKQTKCNTNAFIQCSDGDDTKTEFAHPELRSQMAQLKTERVKGLLNEAMALAYSTGTSSTQWDPQVVLLQEEHARKHRQLRLRGDRLGHRRQSTCSISKNSDCASIVDKFIETSGQVDSDIEKFKADLSRMTFDGKKVLQNLDAQIGDITDRQGTLQAALAYTVQREGDANNALKLKTTEYSEQLKDFAEFKKSCGESFTQYKRQMCALRKIRGELYKMSGQKKYIVDCQVGTWVEGECSAECEGGTVMLAREITLPATLGSKCPPLKLKQTCNERKCPIDCEVDEWNSWSSCSAQCGGGIRERIRQISRRERFGGVPCGPSSETETCSEQDCTRNCVLGHWSKFSSQKCSKACGGGIKVSTKSVEKPAGSGGFCPDEKSETRFRMTTCNMHACAPKATTLLCDSEVDVVILLDGSGSLGQTGWTATVEMGKKLAGAFNNQQVTNKRAQVAVQLFGGPKFWWQFRLCTYGDRRGTGRTADVATDCGIKWVTPLTTTGHFTADSADAVARIGQLQWPKSSTFTSMALSQARAELMYGRPGVPKVVVVVTDGKPISPWLTNAAAEAVKSEARLIWVPVTRHAPQKDLEQWATAPAVQNVVKVEDFQALKNPDVVSKIISDVCPEAF